VTGNDPMNMGFLPDADPLPRLASWADPWEELANNLPDLLISRSLRSAIHSLALISPPPLESRAEQERAMLLLSFLGHGYVWGENPVANRIPRQIALPWFNVSKSLRRPPVLSYASYALNNWYRLDKSKGIELDNLALLQTFLGGKDEAWFILVHIEIEAKAIAAIQALRPAQQAAAENKPEHLLNFHDYQIFA